MERGRVAGQLEGEAVTDVRLTQALSGAGGATAA